MSCKRAAACRSHLTAPPPAAAPSHLRRSLVVARLRKLSFSALRGAASPCASASCTSSTGGPARTCTTSTPRPPLASSMVLQGSLGVGDRCLQAPAGEGDSLTHVQPPATVQPGRGPSACPRCFWRPVLPREGHGRHGTTRTTRAWHFARSAAQARHAGSGRTLPSVSHGAVMPYTTLAPRGASEKSNKHSKRVRGSGQSAWGGRPGRRHGGVAKAAARCEVEGGCNWRPASLAAAAEHHMKSSSPSPADDHVREGAGRQGERHCHTQ